MSLARAQTLYVIVMDIDAEYEAEFERWNDEEHIAERLSCPGFLRASRYRLADDGPPRDPDAAPRPRHMTIYELADPRVLRSEAYIAQTAAPTEWTRRMASRLRVLARDVYVRTATAAADGVATSP